MSRNSYHAVTISGPKAEKCSSCELLNILRQPRATMKRCKECIERENRRKMKSKHIPVHLRQRNLHEQTEKASRILAEEIDAHGVEGVADEENGFVSAARAPLLVSSSGRHPEDEEQVKLSDILELALELLELVESHVGRHGTLEDVSRFESQLKVLRAGRDRARSSTGHVEDKRAIVLAFSIFTEHYTLTIREVEKLLRKNAALKQLAYDTAGLVKKSEAQFESYVSELKSLQGANFEVAHNTKIELTRLRGEVTALKLELNIRTNELREAQVEINATQEQLRRERQRAEEMRKDKDSRITSLLAQLQQFSIDYTHEKGERMRLERENERLWNDRMAARAEQIRSSQLSGAERALAIERDALEKREWLEWKKKAAMREVQSKERLRQEAWEVRQGIEADAFQKMEAIRRELGEGRTELDPAQAARISTVGGRTKEQREHERQQARSDRERAERDRAYWMDLEEMPRARAGDTVPASSAAFPDLSPLSSAPLATAHAQRWGERKAQLDTEAEIDAMIQQLQRQSANLKQPAASSELEREAPASDVIRAGNYAGGVESVLNNPRSSPSLPLFSEHSAQQRTGAHRAPSSVASSAAPLSTTATSAQPHHSYGGGSGITEADRAAIRREMEAEIQAQLAQQQHLHPQPAASSARLADPPRARSSTTTASSSTARPSSDMTSVDLNAVEEGLRRSRKIRGESTRVYSNGAASADDTSHTTSTASRQQQQQPSRTTASTRGGGVTVEDESESAEERDARQERKYDDTRRSSTRARESSRSPSASEERARKHDARARKQSLRAQRSSRQADLASSSDEEEVTRPRSRDRRSRSRSSDRARPLVVDGREAVPVRNFTLYATRQR